MRISYVFPVIIFLLLTAFYSQLPGLNNCVLPFQAKGQRHIDRLDALIMAALTLAYGCLAFIGLGSTKSPHSFADMGGASAVVELCEEKYPQKIMFFSGVGEGVYTVEFSSDGKYWTRLEDQKQDHISVLKWNEYFPRAEEAPRYVRLTGYGGVYLGELAMYDEADEQILLKPAYGDERSRLLTDEQDMACAKQHFLNSSYFDEIYHPRTAWEHLNGVSPYEISHPPLGKLLISLGISIFGMTPFGWRFMGTFFGVLMLPVLYVFVKKMFGGRSVATAAVLVLSTDFMHYVQTRIATIDTYGVFFTLLMYLFMYLFISCENGWEHKKALVFLALSGVSFGLGAASKWTGIYAGAGLAVIWALFWIFERWRGFTAFAKNAAFCLVFFVLVPALIYYLSYAAYGIAEGMHGIGMFFKKEYARIVIENQKFMFNYHSWLEAEHPYSSKWYQWILDIRPILYYLENYNDGTRSSFGAFVNPVLCWGGLFSLFVLIYTAFFRRDKDALFILIAYLAQLIPWILVPRITFAYHYFPCVIFLVLSLAYVFRIMRLGTKRWRLCVGGFALLSLLVFEMFYPALSGIRVNDAAAAKLLKWLPTWPF